MANKITFHTPVAHQPTLTTEQLELTTQLSQTIQAEILRSNTQSIPFSRYMELALYHPQYGYYNNLLHKFGKEGDFVTSPLTSKLFAACICRQIDELFSHEVTENILELGAGNGQLMLDILEDLGPRLKNYYVLELSANLVQLQQQRLQAELPHLLPKVTWLTQLPMQFEGIVLANEVLDAMPCELIAWHEGVACERQVAVIDGKFSDVEHPLSAKVLEVLPDIPKPATDPYYSEVSLNNRGFIASLSQSLLRGAILLIDYGYGESEYYSLDKSAGTLRGFFQHQLLDNVLQFPGLIDITVSVDFTAVAKIGINSGLDLIGYTTQANFLFNCGLLAIAEKQHTSQQGHEYLALTNQINRLTSPNEMGDIFKVIGFSKNIEFSDWLGFTQGDHSYKL
jgi:SAM-dependent MidA family methyltransferase